MSTDSHEDSIEREFGSGDQESINKRALCSSDTSKLGDTAYTNCDDMIRSNMRTSNYVGYDGIQQHDVFKFNKRKACDNLKRLYICRVDENKLNNGRNICSEEQPLDFSRKSISSVRIDDIPPKYKKFAKDSSMTSQGSQENSGNSSDCLNDSCDEEKSEPFTDFSHANETSAPRNAFPMNGSRYTVYNDREEKRPNFNNRSFVKWERNNYKRNGLAAASSSGSEDEFHSKHSVHNDRNYALNGGHSQLKSSHMEHLSAEGKQFPHSQYTVSKMLHLSNRQSENSSSISTEKNDKFHIQGILSHDNHSASVAEHPGAVHQIDNSITEQRTSPHFRNEENVPSKSVSPSPSVNSPPGPSSPSYSVNIPGYVSPNHLAKFPNGYLNPSHSMPLTPSRFPFAITDRLPDSNGIISPYMQTVFPPNHIANFMNHSSPREMSDYCRLYSYPPGHMLQPPLNPMPAPFYQPSVLVGQDQENKKQQRPFKTLNPTTLMQHVPLAEAVAVLSHPSSSYSSPTMRNSECNGTTGMDTSPQSPDSQCIVNGSSGNEMTQDANDDSGRKKIRRIPPEEKDEKYLEKRRKNNLAAKKSRDERRRKEDILALSVQQLVKVKITLEGKYAEAEKNLKIKEQNLNTVIGNLIVFREKCEGRTKELFEETFKLFLPPQ